MAEVNFQVDQTALDLVKNTVIEANFEETKAALVEMVRPYQNMIVTADAISAAKTDRAKIRKVEQSIDGYRKTVKSIYTAPLAEFEGKCKELTGICKQASDNLDSQVKKFEEIQKQEKKESLEQYFQSIPKKHDTSYYIFDRIFDPKWLNVTSKVETAQDFMTRYCAAVDSDVDVILSLESESEAYLLTEYKNGKTISQVMGTAQQLKKSAEEKRRREEEAEKAKMVREMEQKIAQESAASVPTEPEVPDLSMLRQTIVPPTEQPQPELHTVNIWVRGTREQLAKLADLIDAAGLEYGAL